MSGTVTIAANAAYADVTVTVTNDSSDESAETVILTLDEDDAYLLGANEATLFIWDNDGSFVYWTGAANENWMDPDNWDGLAVPGAGDTVVFNGSFTNDVELAGPLSPYAIGELIIQAGYTGTITLAFPLEVGDFQMAGGTIDQPSSAYGSDLTITGAAVWTAGVFPDAGPCGRLAA